MFQTPMLHLSLVRQSFVSETVLTSDNLSIINYFTFVVLWGSAQELRGLGYTKGKPVGLVGVTELSDDQRRQIKEQQDVGNTTDFTFSYV